MTDVREHGLIFSAPMALALLGGRKSMTRRPITRRNSLVDGRQASETMWNELRFDEARIDFGPSPAGNAGPYLKVPRTSGGEEFVHRVYPRYQPGDRMWARETWTWV